MSGYISFLVEFPGSPAADNCIGQGVWVAAEQKPSFSKSKSLEWPEKTEKIRKLLMQMETLLAEN